MHKRTDTYSSNIIDIFKSIGFSVFSTSDTGRGFPDYVIARNGLNLLVEIKTTNNNKPSFTNEQKVFYDYWTGCYLIAIYNKKNNKITIIFKNYTCIYKDFVLLLSSINNVEVLNENNNRV